MNNIDVCSTRQMHFDEPKPNKEKKNELKGRYATLINIYIPRKKTNKKLA